jgi:hypothetical protein
MFKELFFFESEIVYERILILHNRFQFTREIDSEHSTPLELYLKLAICFYKHLTSLRSFALEGIKCY